MEKINIKHLPSEIRREILKIHLIYERDRRITYKNIMKECMNESNKRNERKYCICNICDDFTNIKLEERDDYVEGCGHILCDDCFEEYSKEILKEKYGLSTLIYMDYLPLDYFDD